MDKIRPGRRVAAQFFGLALCFSISLPAVAADACPALLKHSFPVLQDGKSQSLCQWQGKVLLVVNTASRCGLTPQYDGLEKLYERLKGRGLVVIGFPSNDFEQEPGGNQEIADFCRLTYGVEFPMFAKTTVVGPNVSPFYAQLAKAAGGKPPEWNFHKYLIDRSGRQVLSFDSRVRPDDKELLTRIEAFLDK